jgi:hypothetical protein
MYGNNESWCAKTTLHCTFIDEGLLNVCESTVGQTFNSGDVGTDSTSGKHQTTTDGRTVHHDGTTAALTLLARTFRTWESEAFSEYIEQTFAEPRIGNIPKFAVHSQ